MILKRFNIISGLIIATVLITGVVLRILGGRRNDIRKQDTAMCLFLITFALLMMMIIANVIAGL
ncbi:MAG: hypothetical protein IJI66_01815 [Erysipelotrichaceae bacterium]|nr:hypothetical protein [Erysipelotrichaceae bacterium]